MKWLIDAQNYYNEGKKEAALDLVMDKFDDMLLEGKFKQCNDILVSLDEERYSTSILLTILTATAAAKSKLPNRRGFYLRSQVAASRRKGYEPGMFDGLG